MSSSWGSLYRKKTAYYSQKAERPGRGKGDLGNGESIVTGKVNDGAEKYSKEKGGTSE